MQRATTAHAKDKRRTCLLIAAMDEFFEKGFNAARMEDIARRAGLSKGTLYLYFKSKQGLFKALIEDVAMATVTKTAKRAMAATSGPEALTQVMGIIPHLIRTTPMPKLVKVLISDAKAFPELVSFYRIHVIGQVFTMLEAILQRGIKSGDWRPVDVPLTVRLVVAPILFSVIWRVIFEPVNNDDGNLGANELDLDALFAMHTEYLLVALGATPKVYHA